MVGSQAADRRARCLRGSVAGALAAAVWAAQQPVDKRVFGSSYDDVELLGKAVTQGGGWRVAGIALHVANGAAFGAVYAPLRARLGLPGVPAGIAAGLIEHVGLWPLVRVTDRFHPARHELERLTGNRAAFAQATWRHLLFGAVLGAAEVRLSGSSRSGQTR